MNTPERQSRVYVGFQLILVVALLAYIFFLLDFVRNFHKKKAPFVPTKKEDIHFLLQTDVLDNCTSVTDLGCGEGRVLRLFHNHPLVKKSVGYDTNILLIRRGRLQNRRHNQRTVHLQKVDFTTVSLESDLIYVYLLTSQLETLEDRFKQALPEHSRLISNSFAFPNRTPHTRLTNPTTQTTFFVYTKPHSISQTTIKFPQK